MIRRKNALSSVNHSIPPTETYLMVPCTIFRSGTSHSWPGMLLTKWAVASTGTGIYLQHLPTRIIHNKPMDSVFFRKLAHSVSFMTGPKGKNSNF
jgi:hypothetical protein